MEGVMIIENKTEGILWSKVTIKIYDEGWELWIGVSWKQEKQGEEEWNDQEDDLGFSTDTRACDFIINEYSYKTNRPPQNVEVWWVNVFEKLLLLAAEKAEEPDEDNGSDNCSADGSSQSSPRDVELLEEPASEETAQESKNDVPDNAVAFTFHNPTGDESGYESCNKSC